MALPVECYGMVKMFRHWSQASPERNVYDDPTSACVEVMASVVVVAKLLYGLDGRTRSNTLIRGEFVPLKEWLRTLEAHSQHLKDRFETKDQHFLADMATLHPIKYLDYCEDVVFKRTETGQKPIVSLDGEWKQEVRISSVQVEQEEEEEEDVDELEQGQDYPHYAEDVETLPDDLTTVLRHMAAYLGVPLPKLLRRVHRMEIELRMMDILLAMTQQDSIG
jgi:hypothetical protein